MAVTLVAAGVLLIVLSSSLEEVAMPEGHGQVLFPDGTLVTVEIADTRAERAQGLSGHEPLGPEEGMLFLYDELSQYGFWMKDMLFAIDIIWLSGELVMDLDRELPPEEPPTTIYTPSLPVDRVIELPAGFIDKHGVKVGDRLDMNLPEA